jgi:hypothetical protein
MFHKIYPLENVLMFCTVKLKNFEDRRKEQKFSGPLGACPGQKMGQFSAQREVGPSIYLSANILNFTVFSFLIFVFDFCFLFFEFCVYFLQTLKKYTVSSKYLQRNILANIFSLAGNPLRVPLSRTPYFPKDPLCNNQYFIVRVTFFFLIFDFSLLILNFRFLIFGSLFNFSLFDF